MTINKESFLSIAKMIRTTIMIAAAENLTYKWDTDGENAANRFKQDNLKRAEALAHCLMIRELLHDKGSFVLQLEKARDYSGYAMLIEQHKELGLTMPIGRSRNVNVRDPKAVVDALGALIELEEEELRDLGFGLWDKNRNRDGRRLWCIPLWLVPFLKCGQPVTSILGVDKLTGPDLDNDHRGGCVAYGFYLHA